MSVVVKKVKGRRHLKFASLDDMIVDVRQLGSSPHTKTLGNWPLSQLLTHLATTINLSIDGMPFRAAWYMRLAGFFIKGRFLKRGLPAGFKLSNELEARFFPPSPSTEQAVETFQQAVTRMKTEKMAARHPVLGKLTHEEWIQYHLRHAELHLSFAQ